MSCPCLYVTPCPRLYPLPLAARPSPLAPRLSPLAPRPITLTASRLTSHPPHRRAEGRGGPFSNTLSQWNPTREQLGPNAALRRLAEKRGWLGLEPGGMQPGMQGEMMPGGMQPPGMQQGGMQPPGMQGNMPPPGGTNPTPDPDPDSPPTLTTGITRTRALRPPGGMMGGGTQGGMQPWGGQPPGMQQGGMQQGGISYRGPKPQGLFDLLALSCAALLVMVTSASYF